MKPAQRLETKCTKCGEDVHVRLKYHGNLQTEELRWSCLVCGYTWATPTLDHRPQLRFQAGDA